MEIENLNNCKIKVKEGRKEKEYKLECKFFSNETNSEYWVYSDEIPNEEGNIELKVSKVIKKDEEVVLNACTDESELALVVNMYEALRRRVKINKE